MAQEEQRTHIQYLKDVEKLSFSQIEEKTGIARKKCSKLYYDKFNDRCPKGSVLDEYSQLIRHWFEEFPKIRANQIFERLQERRVSVSYSSVVRATRELRRKKVRAYFPLTFLPGEEGQVDWFFVTHPRLGKLAGFALILSYSRALFAHFFQRHSFEFFIQGHLMAFDAFAGLPQALRYDNLKSVVLKRIPLTYHPAFVDFARHYGFEIRLCNVRAGNEKGRVERVIRSVRETFLNTADAYQTLPALNQALYSWVDKREHAIHRSTEKPPALLKAQEALKPLPQHPWLNCAIHPPTKPSKTGLITFDTNQYSVPEYLLRQFLSIHAFCERIEIYDTKEQRIATHPRCFDRRQRLLNPQHRTFSKITEKTKLQRISYVMNNLNPAVCHFLELNQQAGEDPVSSAYTLFQLLKTHSRETLFSAIRETLQRKAPRMKSVLSLLEPQMDCLEEHVSPQNQRLLQLQYQPRPLSEYDHDTTS